MKPVRLLSTLFISFTLISGCLDLSDSEKSELKSFLDGYDESQSEEVSTSAALEKNYIEETEVTSDNAVGSAKLGGEIDAAALSDRSFSQFASGKSLSRAQITSRALDTIDPSDFTVSFINGKGQKITLTIDTSKILINQPASGNPQFIIEGMGDGVNYIVEVSLSVDGGTPINLKSVAFVPKGATKSEKSIINPVSTVIAEAVQEKVKNSFFETGGDSFSQDYISDLNETLGAIIEEVVGTAGGAITAANFEDAVNSEGGIESLVSKLLSDEDVSGGLNKLENAAVADTFSVPETTSDAGEARDIVRELFENNGDEDGGTSDFFINFFGDQFAAGNTKTVNQIFEAIFAGVEFDGAVDLNTFNKTNALAAFTNQLVEIYDAIDDIATLEALATRTAEQKTQLRALREAVSEVPNVILGIFPPERKSDWQALSGSSTFTVPQAITLIFFTLDDYLDELKQFERNEAGQVEEKDGVDFDPQQLLVLYGFNPADTDQLSQYASLDINWMQLHPGQIWLQSANGGNGGQVDVLSLFTCVDAFPEENYTINSVSLTYPNKSGSTGTVTLKSEAELRGDATSVDGTESGSGDQGGESCFTLNPWEESNKLEADFTTGEEGQQFTNWDGIWEFLKNSNKIITDFSSGDYVVTVNYDDTNNGAGLTKTISFEKRVITGLSNLFPKFTSPVGLPRHPEGAASPEEYEAYNEAINGFVMTTFATSDAAVFTWNAPAQLATSPLPEGVVAVYNLDIGRDVCAETELGFNECRWTQVFSSWETGSQIFNTRFELPTEAKGRLEALDLTDTPYQANLSISFVDETTGEQLGQGGWTQAPFRVGEVLDLNSTFNLTGTVTNVPNGDTPLTDYKVAVIKESCAEDKTAEAQTYTWIDEQDISHTETYFPWVCETATLAVAPVVATTDGYAYTVSPTLRNMMGNNQGSYVDIRMFIDADGDDVLDPHMPGNGETQGTEGEQVFWSQSSVHFNNWGGVLRIQTNSDCGENGCNFSEEIVSPAATYQGPDFDGLQNSCCGGEGTPTDILPSITAQSLNDTANLSGNSFTWQHDLVGVDHFEVVVMEVDATSKVELAALVASLEASASGTNITDMLGSANGATNISATAVADANSEESLSLTVITSIDNSKSYIWFVEAYDTAGASLGASDDMNLSPTI